MTERGLQAALPRDLYVDPGTWERERSVCVSVSGSPSTDVSDYRMGRPGLTDPAYQKHWLA